MFALEIATAILEGALAKANDKNVPSTIAIVDAGGHLIVKARMDGVPMVTVRMAEDKAYTSAMLNEPTGDLQGAAQPGAPLFGLSSAEAGRLIVFGGGIPIRAGDRLLGAIGVAGGAVEDDVEIAEAGIAVWSAKQHAGADDGN